MPTKSDIRRAMRVKRRLLSPDERTARSAQICSRVLAREDVQMALQSHRPFAVYLASPDEIDLTTLVDALWSADVTVAVPCWDAARELYVLGAYSSATTLVEGAHHILEPAELIEIASADIGVWIVPGLAFTSGGGRLGYGGGWYDRLLARAAPDALMLGVAYPFQIVNTLPVELHDQSLTAVVTCD